MKILHTADWHLGTFRSPVKDGVNLRTEDTKRCLNEMIRVAGEERPDYSLVSGDIFHSGKTWSDRCCEEIVTATHYIKELAAVSKQVVVMRGTPNHDGIGLFNVLAQTFEPFPNVHIVITPQVIPFEDADIALIPGFDRGIFRANHPGISADVYMIGYEKRWFAVARTATKPENMQGFHEDNMLFIVDEASGVADPIMEAITGTLAGENNKLLLMGNPTKTSGTFYDSHTVDRSLYKCHTVNSEHSKRTNKENIEAMKRKYGADSNVVRVRVYGEFPQQEDDVFIPISWLEQSCKTEISERTARASGGQLEIMQGIVDRLNNSYEGLNLTLDSTNGKLNMSVEDLWQAVTDSANQEKAQANMDKLMDQYEEMKE